MNQTLMVLVQKSLSAKKIQRIKKSGVLYANVNLDEALHKFPIDFLDERQKLVIDRLKGKSGVFELTSGKSQVDFTKYQLSYTFDGDSSSGEQFLDVINSIYIFSK